MEPIQTNKFWSKFPKQAYLDSGPHADLDSLVVQLTRLVERQPRDFIFGQTVNTAIDINRGVGTVVYAGSPVPIGFKGTAKDINVNFSTVAGTVILVKLDAQNNILADLVRGIAASQSGIGSVVLQEGEKLGISIQVQAAGIIGVYFSGEIKKVAD